jgi:hypothetical protein
MKNLKWFLCIIVISLCTSLNAQKSQLFTSIYAQNSYSNTVYFSMQPRDLGIGFRYDHEFKNFGLYTSLTKGRYKFDNYNYSDDYIKNHVKATIGVIFNGMKFDQGREYVNFNLGLSYHTYGERKLESTDIDARVYKPVSFEIGTLFKVNRFAFAARTDILKWEVCFDLGLSF